MTNARVSGPDYETVVNTLFPDSKPETIPANWKQTWARSTESFLAEEPFFLDRAFVQNTCAELGMDKTLQDVFEATRKFIQTNPAVQRLAWHCHWLLFRSAIPQAVNQWAELPAGKSETDKTAECSRMFYAFILLTGIPHAKSLHAARGVNTSISLDTFSDLELWLRDHYANHGTWGLKTMTWISHHLAGRLFKLGRLQFLLDHFRYPFVAYRHKTTNRVIVLAEGGLEFRADGQFANADGQTAGTAVWKSAFTISGTEISGHPVNPRGFVQRKPISLLPEEWTEILRCGDRTLSIHIPATGPMPHDACGESFQQAVSFFKTHFPERPYKAFTCASWLLDPQLDSALGERSNMVRLQRELYLHPIPGANARQTLERVFQTEAVDPATAPRDSSLRRAILEHMDRGNVWRGGGALFFADDLRWNEQVYRTTKFEWLT